MGRTGHTYSPDRLLSMDGACFLYRVGLGAWSPLCLCLSLHLAINQGGRLGKFPPAVGTAVQSLGYLVREGIPS